MNRRLVPWWRSLRVLIAIGVAVVSVVVSGVVGLTLAQQAATAARESLRDQVLGRLATAADGYVIDGRLRGGATLDPTYPPPALVSDLGDGRRATLYDGQWMWAATRIDATNVITVRLDASSLHEQDAVRIRTLAVALGLALVASAGLGWGVGSTLSGRVRRAVRAVHAVERGEQGVRVHSGGNDEVAVLTASVDAMADALAGRLALEQAFTADVAHELRTPLTALVTASELLPDDPASDLTRSQVARMRRLVEDLLTLSRLDAAVEESARETIDLADAAREALSLAAPTVPDARVTLRVESSEPVELDLRRLEHVVRNLLGNLVRHGGGTGELVVSGTRLSLLDDGPGYPDEVLEAGPQRFHGVGRTKGSGLGLTIVEKSLASMGAELVLTNRERAGACTTLQFSPAGR